MQTRDQQNSASEIDVLEDILKVSIPGSYGQFIEAHGIATVWRLPILGLPLTPYLTSVWGATQLLRLQRPDLTWEFVVIRLMDSRALCLDLRNGTKDDAPLVEIDLEGTSDPKTVHSSFAQYIADGRRSEERVKGALRRIKHHLRTSKTRGRQYDHSSGGRFPRAHEFRVLRSCVHDQVVGLAAIRHNEIFNGLEVDVFLSTDHPDYAQGHGVRSLALLILSDAYRNGATMSIHFTRYDRASRRRVPDRIPTELLSLASQSGVTISQQDEAIITHDEAVELFSAIMGLGDEVLEVVAHCQAAGRLTLQGLCYLLSTRIWAVEEATWILLNFHRPEGILFGHDIPEDRLGYLESMSYGRSALLMTKLAQRLNIDSQGYDRGCFTRVNGLTWILRTTRDISLNWDALGRTDSLGPDDLIEVLSRPRAPLPREEGLISDDAETLLKRSGDKTRKFLVYSSDFHDVSNLDGIVRSVEDRTDVRVLVAPFKCSELDQEVDKRMSRARVLRK